MILSLLERIQILNLLPKDGNRMTNGLIEDLKKNLFIAKEEMDATGYVESGSVFMDSVKGPTFVPFGPNGEIRSKWDESKEVSKEVEIIPWIMNKLVEKLKELEKTEKLPIYLDPLYDRFVMKEGE